MKLRQSKKGPGQQLRDNSDLHQCFVKYREIIADNLSKVGRSYGYVSAIDSNGRTIWIADAHRGDGKGDVARASEKLTAFLELEVAIRFVQLNRRQSGSYQ